MLLFKGVRTLTTNIVIEMGYATGIHREALIANRSSFIYLYINYKYFYFQLLIERRKSNEKTS